MNTPDNWRKSSYSGSGDGNACVEIANRQAHVAIRDSKNPSYGSLTFPTGTFATFLTTFKTRQSPAHPIPNAYTTSSTG